MKRGARLGWIALVVTLTLIAAACGEVTDTQPDAIQAVDTDSDDSPDDEPEDPDSTVGDHEGDEEAEDDDEGDEEAEDGDDEGDEEADSAETVVLTNSWRGVTADTITVGISMLDFELLTSLNLTTNGWGDQKAVWEALIAELNEAGGINGRQVEAVYDFYSPLDPSDADRSCSALTEDNEIFANLGGFVGPAGTADPCIVGLNETIMIGGEINADELALARAPWFHPAPTVEFQTINLISLLAQTGRTEGARVFLMGGASSDSEIPLIVEQLEAHNVELVGTAIIEAPEGDDLSQDAEMKVAFERFKAEDANTLMLFGAPSAYIRGHNDAGLAGQISIWSNDSAGLANLGARTAGQGFANGVLTTTGPTEGEIWADPDFQSECVVPLTERIADADLRDPVTYGSGEENWFLAARRYCHALSLFVQIATAAGADLTPTTFGDTAYSEAFDDFTIPGLGPASLSPEKHGAADMVRLSEYDSTVGDGGLAPVTELLDAFP